MRILVSVDIRGNFLFFPFGSIFFWFWYQGTGGILE